MVFGGGAIDEGLGPARVAEAKAWAEHLGHRADIDDFAPGIGADQWQHRLMHEMEFVVVVVFDDGEAELRRQGQEAHPPVGFHQHRGRELMMRREIDRAHALAAKSFRARRADCPGRRARRARLRRRRNEEPRAPAGSCRSSLTTMWPGPARMRAAR